MAMQGVRWRNVREFLDDLPKNHCHVKPPHEFCTVCMRINYIIAHDCPLFHQRPKRKLKPVREVDRSERHEPVKDHLTADDVKQALKGEEFPIIEFAGPRGDARERDEEIFDVRPIEVEPIKEEVPIPKEPSKARTEKGEEEDEDKDRAPPKSKVDPDELMHRIMEELEFTEEEEETEADEEAEVAPGEVDGDSKEPPRVAKKAVTKRRPKGKG